MKQLKLYIKRPLPYLADLEQKKLKELENVFNPI